MNRIHVVAVVVDREVPWVQVDPGDPEDLAAQEVVEEVLRVQPDSARHRLRAHLQISWPRMLRAVASDV